MGGQQSHRSPLFASFHLVPATKQWGEGQTHRGSSMAAILWDETAHSFVPFFPFSPQEYVAYSHTGRIIPAIWFRYDLSPITVKYTERRQPLYRFITSVSPPKPLLLPPFLCLPFLSLLSLSCPEELGFCLRAL